MQMVLAMKLTTFAWNVQDGRSKPDVSFLYMVCYQSKLMPLQDLDDAQKSTKLDSVPGLLPFFGFWSVMPEPTTNLLTPYQPILPVHACWPSIRLHYVSPTRHSHPLPSRSVAHISPRSKRQETRSVPESRPRLGVHRHLQCYGGTLWIRQDRQSGSRVEQPAVVEAVGVYPDCWIRGKD